MAGGFQEALTDSFTGHLRTLGDRSSAGGQLPQAADTGALRGAVKKLRDAERAPRDAPKARDAHPFGSTARPGIRQQRQLFIYMCSDVGKRRHGVEHAVEGVVLYPATLANARSQNRGACLRAGR